MLTKINSTRFEIDDLGKMNLPSTLHARRLENLTLLVLAAHAPPTYQDLEQLVVVVIEPAGILTPELVRLVHQRPL